MTHLQEEHTIGHCLSLVLSLRFFAKIVPYLVVLPQVRDMDYTAHRGQHLPLC